MSFETYDRELEPQEQAAPAMQVTGSGLLVFNEPAWVFLSQGWGADRDVILMFDPETRTAAVVPMLDQDTPASKRWRPEVLRSTEWPRGVKAGQYVRHYRIARGEYPARLMRGPGPRMVTFAVGAAQQAEVGRARELAGSL